MVGPSHGHVVAEAAEAGVVILAKADPRWLAYEVPWQAAIEGLVEDEASWSSFHPVLACHQIPSGGWMVKGIRHAWYLQGHGS